MFSAELSAVSGISPLNLLNFTVIEFLRHYVEDVICNGVVIFSCLLNSILYSNWRRRSLSVRLTTPISSPIPRIDVLSSSVVRHFSHFCLKKYTNFYVTFVLQGRSPYSNLHPSHLWTKCNQQIQLRKIPFPLRDHSCETRHVVVFIVIIICAHVRFGWVQLFYIKRKRMKRMKLLFRNPTKECKREVTKGYPVTSRIPLMESLFGIPIREQWN